MKTAIVYDYIPSVEGGAERALLELAAHFTGNVDLYFGFVVDSPFSRRYLEHLRTIYGKDRIHTGPILRFLKPITFRIMNYLYPATMQNLNLESYDLVISYTAFLAHTVTPPTKGKFLVYMNTPARFLWNLGHAQSLLKRITAPFFVTDIMRFRSQLFDLDAVAHSPRVFSISKAVSTRINTFYNHEAEILYPASVPDVLLTKNYTDQRILRELGTYFVHISRIESYKNIDILIEAATTGSMDTPLLIIGSGPYLAELKAKAKRATFTRTKKHLDSVGLDVEAYGPLLFTGYIEEQLKFKLLANASASFSLNDEDFGITKVESLAVGTPVIGYAAGATPEIIKDGKNGVLYLQNSVHDLLHAIARHKATTYNRGDIRESAKPYTITNFHTNLEKLLHA